MAFPPDHATDRARLDWPLFGWNDDIRPHLNIMTRAGHAVVLATIARTIGPAPRDTGSQMLFGIDAMVGYFSGGCVESDVARHADAVRADGAPRLLVYGDGSPWIDIRLACGGRIDILVERITACDPVIASLDAALTQRRPVRYRTDGRVRHVVDCDPARVPDDGIDVHGDLSRFYRPPSRLVIFGGDPTTLAIARMASVAGIETILVRDDGVTTPATDPLSSLRVVRASPGRALAEVRPDRWTAVIAATHDGDRDHAVLDAALGGEAGYIGVLGAASRLPDRIARLEAAGIDAANIRRLRGPVGRKATGNTPFAIAAGVVAELFEALGGVAR